MVKIIESSDVKSSNPDYQLVVWPFMREQAARLSQQVYQKSRGKRALVFKMRRLTELDDHGFHAHLSQHIKSNQYHLINYQEPHFTKQLFSALRLGIINMNEMMTAKLMHDNLLCFNEEKIPEKSQEKFTRYALATGPYDPSKQISYWTPEASLKLEKLLQSNPGELHYYTINIPRHYAIFILKDALMNPPENTQSANWQRGLIEKYKHLLNQDLKSSVAVNIHQDNLKICDLLAELENKINHAVDNKHWFESSRPLREMLFKYEKKYALMMHAASGNQKTLSSEKKNTREFNNAMILGVVARFRNLLPTMTLSHQEENLPDTFLSLILPTIDTLNALQNILHGAETTLPIPALGQVTTRMIRAYDENLSVKNLPENLLTPTQRVMRKLFSHTDKLNAFSARPVEITYPGIKKTPNVHDWDCSEFLLLWHDLYHAWRSGSNFKAVLRKVRVLYDEKAGFSLHPTLMSKIIWHLSEMEISIGEQIRAAKNPHLEASTLLWGVLLADGLFDFQNDKDENYLLCYALSSHPDEWPKLEWLLDAISKKIIRISHQQQTQLSNFIHKKNAVQHYLDIHPDASVIEIIVSDLLHTIRLGKREYLLGRLRQIDLKDILYWAPQKGLCFKEKREGVDIILRKNNPHTIYEILFDLSQPTAKKRKWDEATPVAKSRFFSHSPRVSQPSFQNTPQIASLC